MSADPLFERLVAERLPALLRLAVMLTGDPSEAEDLVQTALTKAWRHAPRIVAMAAPAAYLRRIVVNEHASALRRHRPTQQLDENLSVQDTIQRVLDSDALWQALAALPPRQRAVLVLRVYEDLDDDEIAVLLEIGASAVRSNASRGMQTLRSQFTLSDSVEQP